MPPVAPMLAKAVDDLPVAEGMIYEPKWDGFRCVVFRDGDEVVLGSRNERPLTRYFPELLDPLRAVAAGALRGRRRDRRGHRRRARLRRPAAAHPPGRVAGESAERRDAGLVRRLRPAGPRRPLAARRAAQASDARCWPRRWPRPRPPIHLSPMTTDRVGGRRLVRAVRGRGPRRRGGQAGRGHLRAEQAGAVQGEAPPHRRLRGRRLPHAQGRRRRGLAAARPVRRRATAAPRRRGLELHGPPPQGAAGRGRALPGRRARGPPVAGVGRGAGPRSADVRGCPGAPSRWNAKKDLSWTPLRPELVAEVAFEQVQNGRFRHSARLVHWRPDRDARVVHLRPARRGGRRSSWPRSSAPDLWTRRRGPTMRSRQAEQPGAVETRVGEAEARRRGLTMRSRQAEQPAR